MQDDLPAPGQTISMFADLGTLDLQYQGLETPETFSIMHPCTLRHKVCFGLPRNFLEVNTDAEFDEWWKRTGISVVLNFRTAGTKLRYIVGNMQRYLGHLVVKIVSDWGKILKSEGVCIPLYHIRAFCAGLHLTLHAGVPGGKGCQ